MKLIDVSAIFYQKLNGGNWSLHDRHRNDQGRPSVFPTRVVYIDCSGLYDRLDNMSLRWISTVNIDFQQGLVISVDMGRSVLLEFIEVRTLTLINISHDMVPV